MLGCNCLCLDSDHLLLWYHFLGSDFESCFFWSIILWVVDFVRDLPIISFSGFTNFSLNILFFNMNLFTTDITDISVLLDCLMFGEQIKKIVSQLNSLLVYFTLYFVLFLSSAYKYYLFIVKQLLLFFYNRCPTLFVA